MFYFDLCPSYSSCAPTDQSDFIRGEGRNNLCIHNTHIAHVRNKTFDMFITRHPKLKYLNP